MSDWWPKLCLFVFVTHLPFFLWRYWKTREPRFGATSATFALLCVTYVLLVFAPGLHVGGAPLWKWVRVPTLLSAVVSIGLLVRHHVLRMRSRTA